MAVYNTITLLHQILKNQATILAVQSDSIEEGSSIEGDKRLISICARMKETSLAVCTKDEEVKE